MAIKWVVVPITRNGVAHVVDALKNTETLYVIDNVQMVQGSGTGNFRVMGNMEVVRWSSLWHFWLIENAVLFGVSIMENY